MHHNCRLRHLFEEDNILIFCRTFSLTICRYRKHTILSKAGQKLVTASYPCSDFRRSKAFFHQLSLLAFAEVSWKFYFDKCPSSKIQRLESWNHKKQSACRSTILFTIRLTWLCLSNVKRKFFFVAHVFIKIYFWWQLLSWTH